jgi:hypothetical protein
MYICDKDEIVDGVIRTIQKIRSDVAEPMERLGYSDEIVEDQLNRLLPEFSSDQKKKQKEIDPNTHRKINLLKIALDIDSKSDIEIMNFLILCWDYDRLIKLFPLFNGSKSLPTVDQFLYMIRPKE